MLIDSTQVFAQTIRKQTDGCWKFDELKNENDQLSFKSMAYQILLKEVYENVVFAGSV